MVKTTFTCAFLDEVAELPGYVEEAVWDKASLVAEYPGVGSSLVEPSLRAAFGPGCLKVNAAGFDALFDCDRRGDTVLFLGVVHQRAVR